MKLLVLLASIVAITSARPDVPHLQGYNYRTPTSSYGTPFTGQNIQNGIPTGSYLPGGGGISGGFINQATSLGGGGLGGISGVVGGVGGFSGQVGVFPGQGGSGVFPGHGGGGIHRPVVDQKHVYFYATADDPAPPAPRVIYEGGGLAGKQTKIIFVKAPSTTKSHAPIVAPAPQSEQKTIVYVLVKKTEESEPIIIPTSAPSEPQKPEVYFIKYKSQKEAEHAISGTLNGQPGAGVSVHEIGNGQDFIGTLKGEESHGGQGFGGIGVDVNQGGGIITGVHNQATLGGGGLQGNYGPPGESGPY